MMAVKPPRPPSPPLTALRAFEAAARLGGFTRAADELCVTPGAVAQQVKQLEAWAGAPLFERRAHGVVLTEAGKVTLPALTEAFDQMGAALQVLRQATSPSRRNSTGWLYGGRGQHVLGGCELDGLGRL